MADFTFLFNRKGAIYPLDLKSEPTLTLQASAIGYPLRKRLLNEWPYNNIYESSLVSLCAKVIVAHAPLVDKAAECVPDELFVPLFKAALYPVKDHALDVSIRRRRRHHKNRKSTSIHSSKSLLFRFSRF
jgi:hypothetical protein